LFNVYDHGTLIQHLKGDLHKTRQPPADPAKPVHEVMVTPGTRLAQIFGEGKVRVNSRHHQAVDKLGEHLLISAKSAGDGIIEGVERADKPFAVAVQWHPEDQVKQDEAQKKLFQAFADAVEQRR
jgi:putative glutamine amidotransferase